MSFKMAERIVEEELMLSGVSLWQLQKGVRTQTVVKVRVKIVQRLRDETDLSWSEVARVVGRKVGYRGTKAVRLGRVAHTLTTVKGNRHSDTG